jgi:tetratricopeptide (TPR) repeat protein
VEIHDHDAGAEADTEEPRPLTSKTRRLSGRRRFFRRLTLVLVVLLGLSIPAGIFARPLYRTAKAIRGRSAAKQGEALLKSGQIEPAVQQLRLAYRFAPKDPEVLRSVAQMNATLRSPDTLSFYEALLATGQARFPDRLAATEVALWSERREVAGTWIQALVKEAPLDRAVWRLAQEHELRFGRISTAIELARHVVALFPSDAEAELELGSLLLRTSERRRREEGLRLLWSIALGRTPWKEEAAQRLAQHPELRTTEAGTLARILEGIPASPLSRRLVVAQLQARARPESREEWAAKVVGWLGPDPSTEDVLGVVNWLADHGTFHLAGPILPEERCRTNRALMGARVDHLVATEKEAELEALLAAPSEVFDDAMRAASRGAMQGKLGRKAAAERAFVDAIETGGRMDLAMPFVAQEALRIGATNVAVRALRRWMEVPGSAMPAGRRLAELLDTLPDLVQRRDALRRLNELVPAEEWVIQELVWAELFTDGNFDWARRECDRWQKQRPEDRSGRMAGALGKWRAGDSVGALALMESGPLDPETMDVREKAAGAIVLGANGRREAARQMIRSIPKAQLKLQMEQLLRPFL